jgi:hypothetical protein
MKRTQWCPWKEIPNRLEKLISTQTVNEEIMEIFILFT